VAVADTRFNSSLTINERFDTNPLFEVKSAHNDDFVTTVTPKISLTQSWRKLKLSASYRADIESFAESEENNQVAHFGSVSIHATLNQNTFLRAGDEISQSTNVFDIAAIAAQNIQIARTSTIYNNLYAGVKNNITKKLELDILAEDTDIEFSDPAQVDTRTESATADFNYVLTNRWKAGTKYQYERFSFNREDAGNASLQFLSLYLTGTPFPTITLALSGGGIYSSDLASNANWIANGSISKKFKRVTFVTDYSRDITQSVGLTNDVTINNVLSTNINTTLTKRLKIILTGRYGKNRSERNSTLVTKYYSGGISGEYGLLPWLRVSGGYSYYRQIADQSSVASDILNHSFFLNFKVTPREFRL